MQDEMRKLVEKSPIFAEYLQLAEKSNVSKKDLSDALIFLALFNASGAPTFTLHFAITKIYSSPELKETLIKELTGATKEEILQNPLLDNVFHEMMRHNAVPRVYYKKAQCDFSMPAANGKSYACLLYTSPSPRDS